MNFYLLIVLEMLYQFVINTTKLHNDFEGNKKYSKCHFICRVYICQGINCFWWLSERLIVRNQMMLTLLQCDSKKILETLNIVMSFCLKKFQHFWQTQRMNFYLPIISFRGVEYISVVTFVLSTNEQILILKET